MMKLFNKKTTAFWIACIVLIPTISLGFDLKIEKEKKVVITNLAGIFTVTAWGVFNWDYFTRSLMYENEGWFGENTKQGGADKLGHFYVNYAFSHLLSNRYEAWGYLPKKAGFLGSMSSFAIMGWMEMGDAFSDYGFSHEDFFMNTLGSIAGYFTYAYPEISSKIDFRVEYMPDFKDIDIFTDYERMKYLVAVKLDGFEGIQNRWLKYLEIHMGYFTRDYCDHDSDNKRYLYLGAGINLSKIFNDFSWKKTSRVLNYIQLPFTYASVKKQLK